MHVTNRLNSNKKIGILIIILALSLFTVIYGPLYIIGYTQTDKKDGWDFEMNDSQLEIATNLWGSDITVGEFYENVSPEILNTMPEELKQYLYTKKMDWPQPNNKRYVGLNYPTLPFIHSKY